MPVSGREQATARANALPLPVIPAALSLRTSTQGPAAAGAAGAGAGAGAVVAGPNTGEGVAGSGSAGAALSGAGVPNNGVGVPAFSGAGVLSNAGGGVAGFELSGGSVAMIPALDCPVPINAPNEPGASGCTVNEPKVDMVGGVANAPVVVPLPGVPATTVVPSNGVTGSCPEYVTGVFVTIGTGRPPLMISGVTGTPGTVVVCTGAVARRPGAVAGTVTRVTAPVS